MTKLEDRGLRKCFDSFVHSKVNSANVSGTVQKFLVQRILNLNLPIMPGTFD